MTNQPLTIGQRCASEHLNTAVGEEEQAGVPPGAMNFSSFKLLMSEVPGDDQFK